jgi:MFS family permease
MRVPRTRGAVSGAIIALLGAWGALIPFIGPTFGYSIGPDDAWNWTNGRLWLSLLPGAVAVLGGLMLMLSARRPTASFGALLGVLAGAWFVVGPTVSQLWNDGVSQAGTVHGSDTLQVFELLGYFLALGVLIVYFAAAALGRLSVRSVRDIELEEGAAAAGVGDTAAPATTSGRFRRGSRLTSRNRGATTTRRDPAVDDR